MKAREFDERFDRGEDVTAHLDLESVRRPNLELRRVNVDFPTWMVEALDREARRLGVTRQSLIKMRIADMLEGLAERESARRLAALGGSEPDARLAPRRRLGPEAEG